MAVTVSVCIPSFNHAAFVVEAIQSVLAQSLQDFEIIVTDDASTDGTADIASRIADPRIRIHRHPENFGPSAAINRCIAAAKGKYVALLGSDDSFAPDKLEQQVAIMEREETVAV